MRRNQDPNNAEISAYSRPGEFVNAPTIQEPGAPDYGRIIKEVLLDLISGGKPRSVKNIEDYGVDRNGTAAFNQGHIPDGQFTDQGTYGPFGRALRPKDKSASPYAQI